MKRIRNLLSVIIVLATTLSMVAQNPGYRYGSAQYEIVDVDLTPPNPTAEINFLIKCEVDASGTATYTGGSILLSTISTFPYFLPGAVGVNFGAGSGSANLDAYVMSISNGVAYIVAATTRIYDLNQVSSDIVVTFLDFPRSSVPGAGLSGDTDPLTPFDNRDGFFALRMLIPYASLGILENYESPVSDVGNLTRRAVGNANASIQLDATTDESVNLDSYSISSDAISGMVPGLTMLEEAGITNLALNPGTGLITFSTVGATPGRYPLQIIAIDDRGGQATNDFFVEIIPQCSTIPSFVDIGNVTPTGGTTSPVLPFDLSPGSLFTLHVEVADGGSPSAGVLVETSALPAGATFVEDPFNPDNYIFSWTPTASSTNVNLTVFATDVDANGVKICESIEIRYKLRVTNVDCNDPSVLYNASITNIDQPAIPPVGLDPAKYYPGISTGIDAVASISGRNSTYSFVWEFTGGANPPLLIASTQAINDVVPPPGYTNIRVTITDENLANCEYVINIPIPFGSLIQCDASIAANNCSAYGDPNTFYQGYSTGMQLTASSTGTAPFTYLWSNGATTKEINVVPSATTIYTVAITDANGCVATATQTISFIDLRCGGNCDPQVANNGGGGGSSDDDDDDNGGNNGGGGSHDDDDDGAGSYGNNDGTANASNGSSDDDDDDHGGNCGNGGNNGGNNKVTICHIPPGNPANWHTISVSQSAVAAHLAHGDFLGACPPDPCKAISYKSNCKIKLCKINGYGCNNGPISVCVSQSQAKTLLNTNNYVLGNCVSKNDPIVYELVNDFFVSPNPSKDKFILSYKLMAATKYNLQVVDYMGRVVYSNDAYATEGFQEEVIGLGDEPAGIYLVSFSAFGEVFTQKVQLVK